MEEKVETDIEKKVGVKVNELMKEVDQVITFLRALSDDVGMRFNKLLAQVDNMVAPLTNTVLKLEEASDHLTNFRETTQRSLEAVTLLEESSKQALEGVQSFKVPDLGAAANQVAAIRNEGSKALETVKSISESTKSLESLQGLKLPELSQFTKQLNTINEASSEALETVRNLDLAMKSMLRDTRGIRPGTPKEVAVAPTPPPAPVAAPPVAERKPAPVFAAPPPPPTPPAETRSRAPVYGPPHGSSSQADEIFRPVEDALNMSAGDTARAILDARDKIMGMTRKFGAIYELASTARELNKYPVRPLDKREKDSLFEKVMSWKQKLVDAMGSS